MRVFDTYLYNAAEQVSYNNTKTYTDTMLSEMGLEYTNIGFMICPSYNFQSETKKACREFPILEKYLRDKYESSFFTSYTDNWVCGDIYVPDDDIPAVLDAFSRMNKVLDSPERCLWLGGINWYGDMDTSPACGIKERYRNWNWCYAPPVKFSGIILRQGHIKSRKYNPIEVVIEATADKIPRDTTDVAKKLEKYFGSYIPQQRERSCMFPHDVDLRYYELEKDFRERLDILFDEMVGEYRNSEPQFITTENRVKLARTGETIKGICDKRSVNKAFKSYDINVAEVSCGVNRIRFSDKHGFRYNIGLFRKRSGVNEFGFYLSITSYDFIIAILQKDFYVTHISQSEEMLCRIAKYCAFLRDVFSDDIAVEFGNCPDWFWKGNRF